MFIAAKVVWIINVALCMYMILTACTYYTITHVCSNANCVEGVHIDVTSMSYILARGPPFSKIMYFFYQKQLVEETMAKKWLFTISSQSEGYSSAIG